MPRLAGKIIIERLARLPVEVDYGSEFRYRDPIIPPNTLTVVISQSGETADTLAALREAKGKGSLTLAICNVIGSMITREAAGTLLTHAGPEIGVASTKAFTSQITASARPWHVSRPGARNPRRQNSPPPWSKNSPCCRASSNRSSLSRKRTKRWSNTLSRAQDFLYLGRGIHFPIALEGALKLKEISYIHAEGYPAGEMKHGPNALIDEKLPVVVLATRDPQSEESQVHYEKTLSNIQEVKARGGIVVAVACEGDEEVAKMADHLITIPVTRELLLPLLEMVPLQLLAYHIAVRRGCDVDQPRNLAKSVTVE